MRPIRALRQRGSPDAYIWQSRFSCVFELVRGGFDVCAGFSGALDNAGDEVDPVLREVVTVAPLGVAIDAVGVRQGGE
jgi:hypothetical protein